MEPRPKELVGVKVRDLALPAGWCFTRTTTVLYVRGPGCTEGGTIPAWNVERLARAVRAKGGRDVWMPVLSEEELKRNTAYRLRRGMVVMDWPK